MCVKANPQRALQMCQSLQSSGDPNQKRTAGGLHQHPHLYKGLLSPDSWWHVYRWIEAFSTYKEAANVMAQVFFEHIIPLLSVPHTAQGHWAHVCNHQHLETSHPLSPTILRKSWEDQWTHQTSYQDLYRTQVILTLPPHCPECPYERPICYRKPIKKFIILVRGWHNSVIMFEMIQGNTALSGCSILRLLLSLMAAAWSPVERSFVSFYLVQRKNGD